jgi:hypothetical protein
MNEVKFTYPAPYWGRNGWTTAKETRLWKSTRYIGGHEGIRRYVGINPINSRGSASCEIHIPEADLSQFILALVDLLPEDQKASLRKGVIEKTMGLGNNKTE